VLLSGDDPAAAAAELATLTGAAAYNLEVVAVRTVGALTHAQVCTLHTSPTSPHPFGENRILRRRHPDAVVSIYRTID